MDAPGIDPHVHQHALSGLARINRLSRVNSTFLLPLLELAGTLGRAELDVLDVACGGADVPLELARKAAAAGVRLKLTLVDRSAGALRFASEQARRMGIAVSPICASALGELPPADAVINSLFLHHLDEADVVHVLRLMGKAARHLLLVSDLRRSWPGLLAAWAGGRMLSRSPVVRFDAPASVRGAWTIDEMRSMASAAGLQDAQIGRTWPWRMLLTWRRTGES